MTTPVRRKDREISTEEAWMVLDTAEFGTLSMVDPRGIPYGIPVNFVRNANTLIIHCAPEGRKLDCLRFQPRVSFSAVGRTHVLSSQFSTEYESAVATGTAEIIDDEQRKVAGLIKLCEKYSPDHLDIAETYIRRSLHRTVLVEISVESVTGKAKRRTTHP